jgi:hypothetical protein
MDAYLIDQPTDKSKRVRIPYMDETIVLTLRLIDTNNNFVVQPERVVHRNVIYDAWQKEHGSFLKLLEKCLGRQLDKSRGMRQKYLDEWYYHHK